MLEVRLVSEHRRGEEVVRAEGCVRIIIRVDLMKGFTSSL